MGLVSECRRQHGMAATAAGGGDQASSGCPYVGGMAPSWQPAS